MEKGLSKLVSRPKPITAARSRESIAFRLSPIQLL